MTECINFTKNNTSEPQCQFFVVRKKRLCRMTVRPGRQYCGEHEPQPQAEDGVIDTRIPCPNDPKHTCYASKLEKHLSICNARQVAAPEYIVPNINIPDVTEGSPRKLLSEVPKDVLMKVIDKVNFIYDKYVKDEMEVVPEEAIHPAVVPEFKQAQRTESSRRHLRQASSLLRLLEREGLVADRTCYVELGAGKGHLSYYAWSAWCTPLAGGAGSGVLLVDRASLRHKRDNKLRGGGGVLRLRADLAHLALARVPLVHGSDRLVGLAKHLCGVATDHALRCLCAAETVRRVRGIVLATCCHHRCLPQLYLGNTQLQELGINSEDLNVMLGIVSWATCGDGRSRQSRLAGGDTASAGGTTAREPPAVDHGDDRLHDGGTNGELTRIDPLNGVPIKDSYENHSGESTICRESVVEQDSRMDTNGNHARLTREGTDRETPAVDTDEDCRVHDETSLDASEGQSGRVKLDGSTRAEAGRRAKAVLDWGRVLFLRELGFRARLCHYVSAGVSPENVCIVASRPDA